MKNRSKILLALLIVLTLMVGMFTITANAAKIPGGTKLYLVPSSNWNQSNARFAAYFFGDGEVWVSMTKVAGESNVYEVTVPAGKNFTNVIFCRMNPSATANNWNNKWNQTSDLVYNGTSNCYTIKEGTWDKGGGTWSTYASTCSHANVGPAATCTTAQECLDCGDPVVSALGHTYNASHLCTRCGEQATFTVAGTGAHLGTEWDTGNTANDMTFADGTYTKVYTNVAAGSYKFKVARNHDWGTAYPGADKVYSVSKAGSRVTITLTGTTVSVKVEAPVAQVGSQKFFSLQDAINAAIDGDTITLLSSCSGDVTFVRAADVDITLDGNNYTFSGTITVDGKSATFETGSLTIKNVKFNASSISKDACINFGGNNATRYITNVTVENCTFTGKDQKKVAIKSYTGGDKNINVVGCTVDNTMHSILQVTGVDGLAIDGCTVNSKNGINLNSSTNVTVKNSAIDVSGYAVRAGVNEGGSSGAIELTNNTLKSSATDEGVIVLRESAKTDVDLNMTENIVSGAIHLQGTAADTKVSAELNYWDGKTVPAVDGTPIKIVEVYADEAKTETAVAGLRGTGTEADPFLINNLKDLVWFANDVNAGNTYAKKFVKLTADIDLENNAWTPIGTSKKVSFQGTFDGGEHTVSNLYINNEDLSYAGLFGYAQNAKINNVNVHNVNIVAYSNVAAIAGTVYTGSVSNCHVSGSINLVASYAYAAGIVSDGYVTVSDCSVIADGMGVIYVGEKTMAGGITGWLGEGKNGVYNCVVKNLDITAWTSVGAITGLVHYNNTITGCTVENVKLTKTRQNGQAAIGLAAGNWSNKADDNYTITITDNSFTNVSMSGNAINETQVLYGANYSYYDKVIKLVESGNTYEGITDNMTLVIYAASDLKNALAYNKSGAVIVLGCDLTVTDTLVVNGADLTLDLNGYTLTFEGAATYALRNVPAMISVTGNGNLVITGNGRILTNGATISAEDGSDIEILNGTFDADLSDYLTDGMRMTVAIQPDGSVHYGAVSNHATVYIGNDGNWWVGDYNTGVPAKHDFEISDDGFWVINGVKTDMPAAPADGKDATVEIVKVDGIDYWFFNGQNSGVPAAGVDGVGIESITSTLDGNVEKLTIKYTSGDEVSFNVVHGNPGAVGKPGVAGDKGQTGPKGDTGSAGAPGANNNWLVDPVLMACIAAVVLSVVVVLIINRRVLVNQILKFKR